MEIQDSDYDDNGQSVPGVKITIKEQFEVDGMDCNKFHTTRVAIVKRLKMQSLRADVNENKKSLGPIKCVKEKTNAGKDFFNLVDV